MNPLKSTVALSSKSKLPTQYGEFTLRSYTDGEECHLALSLGDLEQGKDVLVRVHSECLTGDIFGSRRCDCGLQLEKAMKLIQEKSEGLVIYLRGHEGRGIGLEEKLKAYALQDQGLDTVDANLYLGHPIDQRDYGIAVAILNELKVQSIHLLSNNPQKMSQLKNYGIKISKMIPLQTRYILENRHYLHAKKQKLDHFTLL